eukprot:676107-Prymnesium_polylepis.1
MPLASCRAHVRRSSASCPASAGCGESTKPCGPGDEMEQPTLGASGEEQDNLAHAAGPLARAICPDRRRAG